MSKSVIEGIGTIYGDTYDELRIEGIGKLKGDADAKIVSVEGLFKGKGRITADKFTCEGIARIFKDIKAREVRIDGIMKLRGCKLESDSLYCDGIIVCNREISADNIIVDGICSVSRMFGDNIKIHHDLDNKTWQKLPVKEKSLFKLYFGRDLSLDYSSVDHIECTRLEAEGLHAKSIKAHNIMLGKNCVIDNIECDNEFEVHPSCRIGKSNINYKKSEEVAEMADIRIAEVLDKYKRGLINADEAEQLIDIIKGNIVAGSDATGAAGNVPWGDDNKLRIVAFIGRKLLKKGEAGSNNIVVKYEGEVLNVECCGSLTCGDIKGNASAGGSISSNSIGGSVSCGGSLTASSIGGSVTEGGGIRR